MVMCGARETEVGARVETGTVCPPYNLFGHSQLMLDCKRCKALSQQWGDGCPEAARTAYRRTGRSPRPCNPLDSHLKETPLQNAVDSRGASTFFVIDPCEHRLTQHGLVVQVVARAQTVGPARGLILEQYGTARADRDLVGSSLCPSGRRLHHTLRSRPRWSPWPLPGCSLSTSTPSRSASWICGVRLLAARTDSVLALTFRLSSPTDTSSWTAPPGLQIPLIENLASHQGSYDTLNLTDNSLTVLGNIPLCAWERAE